MRRSPRERRLNSDFQSVLKLDQESTIFTFDAVGDPPQRYRLTFNGLGIKREPNGRISLCNQHQVLVELGAAYPRMVPNLAWQTPIFHPNISNNGVVCLGGYGTHWVPSLTFDEMCTMLWDMIRFKNFDTESPYNRDAALWAKNQVEFQFPIDPRSIRDRITGEARSTTARAEVVVVNVNDNSVVKSVAEETPVAEILETDIEIIERRNDHLDSNDGIVFLD